MELFAALGFHWDRSVLPGEVPVHALHHVCARFHRSLADHAWDAATLAGNPLSFIEVKTLADGGIVRGNMPSAQREVIGLIAGHKQLGELICMYLPISMSHVGCIT